MPWYTSAKDRLIDAFVNDTAPGVEVGLFVCGVDESYTFDPTHTTLTDLGDSIVLDETELENVDVTEGVFTADNVRYDHPAAGLTAVAAILYFKWATGNQLLVYNASADGQLPFSTIGGNVFLNWAVQGVMKL